MVRRLRPRGTLEAAVYGLSLLVDHQLSANVDRYAGKVELVVLPPANPLDVQATDFGYAERLIEDGYAATAEALAAVEPADERPVASRTALRR
jgi:hypothetical protein